MNKKIILLLFTLVGIFGLCHRAEPDIPRHVAPKNMNTVCWNRAYYGPTIYLKKGFRTKSWDSNRDYVATNGKGTACTTRAYRIENVVQPK